MTVWMDVKLGFFWHNQAFGDAATASFATPDPNPSNNTAWIVASPIEVERPPEPVMLETPLPDRELISQHGLPEAFEEPQRVGVAVTPRRRRRSTTFPSTVRTAVGRTLASR